MLSFFAFNRFLSDSKECSKFTLESIRVGSSYTSATVYFRDVVTLVARSTGVVHAISVWYNMYMMPLSESSLSNVVVSTGPFSHSSIGEH